MKILKFILILYLTCLFLLSHSKYRYSIPNDIGVTIIGLQEQIDIWSRPIFDINISGGIYSHDFLIRPQLQNYRNTICSSENEYELQFVKSTHARPKFIRLKNRAWSEWRYTDQRSSTETNKYRSSEPHTYSHRVNGYRTKTTV